MKHLLYLSKIMGGRPMRQLKRLAALTFALFCCLQTALAYDFSAVSPSGHTIYYNIVNGGYQIPRVSVTYPNTSESPWGNIQKPYGNLVLPETVTYNGTTYNVAYIGEKAFQGCVGLVSVVIPSFVLSINYNSFSGCESLTTVTINSGSITSGPYSSGMSLNNIFGSQVTNIVIGPVTTIGDFAFYHCQNLATVTIPSSVQSIGNAAFAFCGSLYRVFISDLTAWCRINFASETSNPLYQAHHLYLNNSLVTHVSFPSTLTSIKKYAFYGCSDLVSVDISNSVTFIGENAFRECTGLTSVFIPSGVSSISEGTFRGCTSLASVDLPYLFEIGDYAFYHCNSLNDLVIPNSVVSIGTYAFESCSSLTSVTIPSSVNTIGQYAFDACPQMTSVTINSNAIVSDSYSHYHNLGNVFGDYNRSFIFGSNVTSIGAFAFSGCTRMTSVTIPSSVTLIEYSAFENCSGLNRVQISDMNAWYAIDFSNAYANPLYYADHFYVNTNEVVNLTVTSNISEIKDYAFVGYKGLHSVNFGNSVTSIGYQAFKNCSSLNSVTIGSSVNTIEDEAFRNCSSLASITIPNNVTSIGTDAFKDCTNLTSVTLNNNAIASADYTSSNNLKSIFGNQVTSYTFGAIVASIGDYAFYGSTGLTSVTIPNTLYTIGENAFYGCTGIISVTFAGTPLSIGNQAFGGCNGLTRVNISDLPGWCRIIFNGSASNPLSNAHHLYLNNTEITHLNIPSSVTSIGNYAFYSCKGLTSLTIHDGVTSIGAGAFIGCTGLTGMHVDASEPPTAYSATFNNVPTAIPIYVPIGSVPSYKAATGWSRFTNYKGVASPDDLIATVPYEQSFYQNFIPSKWTSYEGQLIWDGSINKYTANLSTNSDNWFFGYVNGTFLSSHAWASIGLAVRYIWLVSPIMHLDGEYNMLSFDMALTQASGFLTPVTPGAQNNTRIFALVSTDHGLTWTKLEAWKHNTNTYSEIESLAPHGATFAYNLENYADQDIMVGFYVDCSNANDAYNRVHIDNFFVGEFDPSTPPTVAVDDITGYTATVSWAPAFAWQQGWDFYYKSEYDGLEPYYASLENLQATGRFHHLTETSYALTNLVANRYYQVWVRHRDPLLGTQSDWTPATYFQTTSQCAPPKNPQVVTTQNSATITWEPGQPNQESWYIMIDGYSGHDMGGEDIDTPSFTLTDLTPGSEFTAEISGYCGGDDGSSDAIYVEFSTDDYDHLTVNDEGELSSNVVIIGDYCGNQNNMSQTQFVIPAYYLTDMQYSTINQLSFYCGDRVNSWGNAEFKVYLTEIDESHFANYCGDSFVNWNDMSQFYQGSLNIENHVMTIESQSGYSYHYTDGNLVVGIKQYQVGSYCQDLEWFGGSTTTQQALYEPVGDDPQCELFIPEVTFTYEVDHYDPPTEFMAYPTSSNEVYFGWMPSEGATAYEIEVSESPDFGEIYDQHLVGLTGYEYIWVDYDLLEPDNTYFARIRALYQRYGVVYGSSWSESVEFMTLEACPVPTDLTATEVGNLIVELDWTGDATEWVIAFQADGEIGERYLNTYHHPYYLEAPYLEPGTTYTVRIHPLCPNGGFVFCEPITFTTSNNIVFADQNVKALCVASSTGWDTSGDGELSFAEAAEVTTLGEVFRNKTNITSFDELQYFTGLTSIADYAFNRCVSLTSVVIPVDVTNIGANAFSYCPNLTSVIIPEGLKTIGNYAFMYDTHLTGVDFPESLKTIGAQSFDNCTSLTYLFIPASVTSITYTAFIGCSGLEYVNVAPGNTVYDSRNDCNAIISTNYNELRVGCKTTIIPNTVTSIGAHAFRENTALTSIDLPESITAINDYAFLQCSGLNAITLPSSVASIGKRAFRDCTGLQFITVEAAIPPSIFTGEDDSFYGVDKAIPVYVPCASFGDYQNFNGSPWGGFTNIVSEGCLQTITLNGGWNWWAPTLEMELGDIETNLGNRGILILSQNEGFARYENGWNGTLSEVGLGKMYKIQLTAGDPVFFEVEGGLSSGTTVTIEPGFNWIGYTGPAGLSITEALGSFEPNDGDEIIDENGDSVYYDGENWEGNFTSLNPGKGYLYHSVANETKMITF